MVNKYKAVISKLQCEADELMSDEQIKECKKIINSALLVDKSIELLYDNAIIVSMAIALGKVFNLNLEVDDIKRLFKSDISIKHSSILFNPVSTGIKHISRTDYVGITQTIGWKLANYFAKQYKAESETNVVNDDYSLTDDIEELFGEED